MIRMKATLTSKGQITLPVAIRRRLGLQAGDVLEFDESVPYIKANKPFSREQMRSVVGRGKDRSPARPSSEWVEELRGPVELP
jgi:AbrB family looped-hinge helix DNA binding protein